LGRQSSSRKEVNIDTDLIIKGFIIKRNGYETHKEKTTR